MDTSSCCVPTLVNQYIYMRCEVPLHLSVHIPFLHTEPEVSQNGEFPWFWTESIYRNLTVAVYHNFDMSADVGETSERASTDGGIKLCPFWNEFLLFSPDPAAPFLDEFRRLANHMKWSKRKKREYLVKALNAEIDFHGDESFGLVRWQRLCQELRIGSEPESSELKSVTKCKKVSLGTLLKHPDMADAM